VLVRTDLASNFRAVQVAHACLHAGAQFGAPDGHNIIVCAVPDERSLLAEVERLTQADIPLSLFYEPDGGVGYSALCTGPITGPQRRLFRHYRLLQPDTPKEVAPPL